MSLTILKKARVGLSLVFFVSTALVFLDLRNMLPPAVIRDILFLQFTPSLINFLSLGGIAACGFIFVLALTLFFGRVYCSTICPLGTLQDVVSYASRKIGVGISHKPLDSHLWIHIAFLLAVLFPLAAGSLFAVSLLDPFSNFGRISESLVRPLLVTTNNGLSSLLEVIKNYDVYSVELKRTFIGSVAISLAFLALLGWMAFNHGRLYCNSICPVGSLLRLVSRFSIFKIAIDAENCKSCQLCQRVCKAGCIDRKKKTIDYSRCVGCFNCFSACPSGSLKFVSSLRMKKPGQTSLNNQRRSFLLGSSLFLIQRGTAPDTTKVPKPQKESIIPEQRIHEVTPPGSISLRHFAQTCTACHVCVTACPSQVLQPSFLEYGFAGILQPRMDFNASYCNFECTRCTEVCPSGALKKLTVEEKKSNQSGRVVFVKQNCVVYTENTDCGACTEHCPTKAVTMIPYKNSRIPEVKTEYCIGCGACEHACPTRPYRAIYVDGNPIHFVAQKKPSEKTPDLILQDEFPF